MHKKALIHSTAIIDSDATIESDVVVGPYSIIGRAVIRSGSVIHPHVVVSDGVYIGARTEIFPGAFLGKEPKGAGALARQPEFNRHVTIGDECSIGPNAVIYVDVEIGRNTLIGDGASVREQCRIGERCIISRYVTVNYNTQIGDRTKIMDGSHITGNATIGSDVFISTLVGTTNDNLMRAGYASHVAGPVIEDGAMIGAGAGLLPAVRIGRGSMVAAGAVVTKDVPEATLVVGIPARAVRKLGG